VLLNKIYKKAHDISLYTILTVFKLGFFESIEWLPGQSPAPHINVKLLLKFSVSGFRTTALIIFPQIDALRRNNYLNL
jgi:hypothetical protein